MKTSALFSALVSTLILTTAAYAGQSRGELPELETLANEWYAQQLIVRSDKHDPIECRPSSAECVREIADRFYSPSLDTMTRIARACSGNHGRECVKTTLDRFYSPSLDTCLLVAESCKGNRDNGCTSYIAGKFYSPSLDTLVKINQACRHADGECVKYIGDKYYSPSLDTLLEIAQSCGGSSDES